MGAVRGSGALLSSSASALTCSFPMHSCMCNTSLVAHMQMHHPLVTTVNDEVPEHHQGWRDLRTLLAAHDNVRLVLSGHNHKVGVCGRPAGHAQLAVCALGECSEAASVHNTHLLTCLSNFGRALIGKTCTLSPRSPCPPPDTTLKTSSSWTCCPMAATSGQTRARTAEALGAAIIGRTTARLGTKLSGRLQTRVGGPNSNVFLGF